MIGVGEKSVLSLQTFADAGADFYELHWWMWSEWWDGFGVGVAIRIGFASKEALNCRKGYVAIGGTERERITASEARRRYPGPEHQLLQR